MSAEEDRQRARERIAAMRAKLPPQTKHRRTTPPLRTNGPSLKERAAERERKAKKEQQR